MPNSCENGKGISTNPQNPLNCEIPSLTNNFDWKLQSTTTGPEYYVIQKSQTTQQQVWNPFKGPSDAEYTNWLTGGLGNLANNYYPEDGWELLKVNFGKFNSNPSLGVYPKLPYLILYNRYNGTLRFFGSLMEPDNTYKTVQIKLKVPKEKLDANQFNLYQQDLSATNLLSIQGTSVQPLDKETKESELNVYVKYTNNASVFFWFDIPTSFDPCVCQYKSQLEVSFDFVETADIDLIGVLTGEIKTKNDGGGTRDYGKMVFDRIIGASTATVTAVASQGTIVNVKSYIDLIDIFYNKPNTPEDDRAKLSSLKNYLSCTNEFYELLKDQVGSMENNDDANTESIIKGMKILDGSMTFYSSLANKCSSTSENSSTFITGALELHGKVTKIDGISGTQVNLAMPGSNWGSTNLAETEYIANGTLVPAYSTYNERLGTFALLETPKIDFYEYYNPNQQSYVQWSNPYHMYVKLNTNLKYVFNPKMNINLSKTKINCRYVIDTPLAIISPNYNPLLLTNVYEPLNIAKYEDNIFEMLSPFVPIDQFKSLPFYSVFDRHYINQNTILKDHIYIQFQIFFESNDIGKNGEPNKSYIFLTYPVSIINHFEVKSPEVGDVNISQEIKKYDTDQIFSNDAEYIFDDIVIITAKLSTSNGKKVKIYSNKGFIIKDGGEISPDIELIPGSPLAIISQPAATYSQVSNFCDPSNPNKSYRANIFAPTSLLASTKSNPNTRKKSNIYQNVSISPNPTSDNITIKLDNIELNNISYKVIDVTGKIVIEQSIDPQSNLNFNVDLANQAKGVYIISIFNGSSLIQNHKVIKL